jgi:hypothetical protein
VIRVGKEMANRAQAGTPVGQLDHFLGIESMIDCPAFPYSSYGRSGVDQHSVKVKQQSTAGNFYHSLA